MINVIPINDLKDHQEDSTCKCRPTLKMEEGEMILVHNSYDRRELGEQGREFVNVLTRAGERIYVGDRLESVQGTVFDVIRLEHISGVKYAIHDGVRPYDLEDFMSPNLWLVNE